MRRSLFMSIVTVALVSLGYAPGTVWAQASIGGLVSDETDAVLPGVTVEATSPALIEGTRVGVSDGQGRYNIVNLRPGTYTLTFGLPGFNTVVRDELDLAGDSALAINVSMQVGAVDETLTVSGEAPVIDVQSTQRTQVLTQEILEAVPSGRSLWAMTQSVVGAVSDYPDAGGTQGMHYPNISLRGMAADQNSIEIDGMVASTVDNSPQYFNTQLVEEAVYETSGFSAETSGGGLRVNMIPKSGGNSFAFSGFGAYSNGAWQSDNLSDELQRRGMTSVTSVNKVWDFNPGLGGPIVRDKLWFFTSYRHWGMHRPIGGSFYDDGSQSVDDSRIQSALLRFTYQIGSSNKLSVYYDRMDKFRSNDTSAGVDPETAGRQWLSPHYATQQAKFTSTIGTRLLIETGYNAVFQQWWAAMKPGVLQPRGTPEWFSGAAHFDTSTGELTNAYYRRQGTFESRYGIQSSASYVTGSHSFKGGFRWQFGHDGFARQSNGDLHSQRYVDGVPDAVRVTNYPLTSSERHGGQNLLNADLGIYAQDTWTIDQLTLNMGIRWEYWNGSTAAASVPAGRFVPAREFPDLKNLPNWKDWAPRLGVAYDLFGNGRTALKAGFNRYNDQADTRFAGMYNPLSEATATLDWNDLNGDDIAQDNEIDFSTLPSGFGGARITNTASADIQRPYALEFHAQVDREVVTNLSIGFGYYHRTLKDIIFSDNLDIGLDDYSPVSVVSPLDGSNFTVYNVNPDAVRGNRVVDSTSTDSDKRGAWSDTFEVSFNGRLDSGHTFYGGLGVQKYREATCDSLDDPNTLRFCDQRSEDIPWRAQAKLSGTHQMPANFQFAWTLSSEPGPIVPGGSANRLSSGFNGSNVTYWRIRRNTTYDDGTLVVPNLTQSSISVPLASPGTEYLDRYTLLDISFSRGFETADGVRIRPQFDMFNVSNASPVFGIRTAEYGAATYKQPSRTMQGRMIRFSMQMNF